MFIPLLYAQLVHTHFLAILTLNILYKGYVQHKIFPEGHFLLKQGDFSSKQGISTTIKHSPSCFIMYQLLKAQVHYSPRQVVCGSDDADLFKFIWYPYQNCDYH